MSPVAARQDLQRVIGFWGGLAVIVGITIGSGIFRKPHTLARDVGDPVLILGLWAFFGLVSLCGALALAELDRLGPLGAPLIGGAILCSVFGALNGNILAKPRVAYAMARDGLTFSFLGKAHPRWSTPCSPLAGLLIAAAGCPVYLAWRRLVPPVIAATQEAP